VKKLFVCVLLVVSACHDKRPPVPTTEQSNRLNEAESMLNDVAANEEGPGANASGPSKSSH
jgi:hypothetical protein